MTPRQRWLALLAGKSPDRVPVDYWATGEFTRKLKKAMGCDTDEALWTKLHIDRPRYLAPKPIHAHHPDDPEADLWGVRRKLIKYETGSYNEVSHCPLAHVTSPAELKSIRWPTTADYDYAPITRAVESDDGYRMLHAGQFEPFLLYCNLRGLEQGFEDLLVNTDIADAVLGRIFDFHFEHTRRIFEAGKGRIDLTYIAEDLGGQTAPLMGLQTYRRFLLPNQIRMADLARKHKVHIMYHTDGSAAPFLPDLVDKVGIEILNPIQWRCPGMERETLVKDFGKRIAFHGAMDNQQTLPFGTVDDVIAEVRDNLRIFKSARWLCAPCHNIQAVSPVENIIAMYRTIHDLGKL